VPRTAAGTLHREALSERERQVLELVEAGLGNAEIADRLCVTEHTVKSHLGSVFAKLGVHSRAEALAAHAGGAGTPESRDPIVPRLVRPA
jgi:DNA-binding CsgD family transcriptional regulator